MVALKIYFYFKVLFWSVMYLLIFTRHPVWYDFLSVPVVVISLIGLFGYAYRKKIIGVWFWRVWIVLWFTWEAYIAFFQFDRTIMERLSERTAVIVLFIVTLLVIPQTISVILYGFGSNDLWCNVPIDVHQNSSDGKRV